MVFRMELGILGEKVAYGLGLKRDLMRPVGRQFIFKKLENRCPGIEIGKNRVWTGYGNLLWLKHNAFEMTEKSACNLRLQKVNFIW